MVTFEQLKKTLESLPFGITNVTENSRLAEDFDLEEEDAETVLNYVQMQLQVDFPEDDAFYRFAAHMPVKELVEICNTEFEDPFM